MSQTVDEKMGSTHSLTNSFTHSPTNPSTHHPTNSSTHSPTNPSTHPPSSEAAIKVEHVSKKYCKSLKRSMLYGVEDIGRNMVGLHSRPERLRKNEFWAVDDISFEVKKGETLGIIGPNGAGKTTLLKMLNGIFWPDKGKISIKGRVGALIEVGAGFHPMLTGRENIHINAAILGMPKKEADEKFDEIVEFADIGDFLDTPVKFYSSGMFIRLGFAIAVHCEPDILLVDEVLAVGDMFFRRKCLNKINELRKTGTTIVFVSHYLTAVQSVCCNVLWLERGIMRQIGNTQQIINNYSNEINNEIIASGKPSTDVSLERFGSGEMQIDSVSLLHNGKETNTFNTGDSMCVEIIYRIYERIREPRFWIAICDNEGRKLTGSVSKVNKGQTLYEGKGRVSCTFNSLPFLPGIYSLIVGILDKNLSQVPYDRWGKATTFIVQVPHSHITQKFRNPDFHGIFQIKSRWKF